MNEASDRSVTLTRPFHVRQGAKGRQELQACEARPVEKGGRVPWASRLMALAIRLETLVRAGEVADYAELARLGLVTRVRMTQIMGLLSLAPDIQEQTLFLPPTAKGREALTERHLRPIVRELDWRAQRAEWASLRQDSA